MSDAKPAAAEPTVMEQIVALCKRRGFVYPASEIYGGIRGFWDYGPLGVLLKNNIRDWWWQQMVLTPPIGPDGHPVDMVGLDSSIIQHPKTWMASGHVAGFNDPMIDDVETKQRFRADHFFGFFVAPPEELDPDQIAEAVKSGEAEAGKCACSFIASTVGEAIQSFLAVGKRAPWSSALKARVKGVTQQSEDGVIIELVSGTKQLLWISDIKIDGAGGHHEYGYSKDEVPSPYTGKLGTLTEPRPFNLMLDTYPGPIRDEANKAYLRPETAQGIFLNYKNVIDTTRVKVPFGVAQVGKSFRNEVTPRNFIFRSREFEQMEMEWFCAPDDALKWYEFWKQERMKWWLSLGVKPENLIFRDHAQDELSHYSKATVDIEYKYPFTAPDFGELEGIAHRGSYDLTQHQTHSGQKLDYFDQELQLKLKEQGASAEEIKARSRYIPNVIEPASGLTRAVLVLLCEAYTPDPGRPSGVYMKFKPRFAPVKAGVYPLVNKDGMPEVAEKLYLDLRNSFTCEYDAKQAIGKRYARMDEIGTPFCITVDGDTQKDQTVTVRHRDTQAQERVAIDKVKAYVRDRLEE